MKNIIFIHIPKSAGSTVQSIIARKLDSSHRYLLNNQRPLESIESLKELPTSQKEEISFIMGHMDFGIHTYFAKPFKYVTIFRNPIDRVISHYYYVKRNPHHYLYKWFIETKPDLKQYVESGKSLELNNGMVRILTGNSGFHHDPNYSLYPYGKCPDSLLDEAIQNLDQFFIAFGIQEKFNESLLHISRVLKLGSMHYFSRNVTANKPLSTSIDVNTLKVIEQYNKLDIQFYQYAEQKFMQYIQSDSSYFQRKLNHLKLKNLVYSYYVRIDGKIRRNLRR